MAVDSNQKAIGLTLNNQIVSVRDIKKHKSREFLEPQNPILLNDSVTIYGLWSRHGGFFPPYSGLPDVYWLALIYNLSFLE